MLLETKVRCSGKLHRIQVNTETGRFILADHLDPEYDEACKVMAAMDDKAAVIYEEGKTRRIPRCHQAKSHFIHKWASHFPDPLRNYVYEQAGKYHQRRTKQARLKQVEIVRPNGSSHKLWTGDKLVVSPFSERLCERVRGVLMREMRKTIYREQLRAVFGRDEVKKVTYDIKVSARQEGASFVGWYVSNDQKSGWSRGMWRPIGPNALTFNLELTLPLSWYQSVRHRGVHIVSGHLVVQVDKVAANGSMKVVAARLTKLNKDEPMTAMMVLQEAVITKHGDGYFLRFINPASQTFSQYPLRRA
jgi:hypothetical protein